jgi:hypothetical protein
MIGFEDALQHELYWEDVTKILVIAHPSYYTME